MAVHISPRAPSRPDPPSGSRSASTSASPRGSLACAYAQVQPSPAPAPTSADPVPQLASNLHQLDDLLYSQGTLCVPDQRSGPVLRLARSGTTTVPQLT